MDTDSKARKETPIWSGVLQYFPRTMAALARVSWKGNQKHNPGQPLHWSREKSCDHEDCIIRHMINPYERDTDGEYHIDHAVWRAAAAAEVFHEKQDPLDEIAAREGN
jgi:hypothetical protein